MEIVGVLATYTEVMEILRCACNFIMKFRPYEQYFKRPIFIYLLWNIEELQMRKLFLDNLRL